MAHFAKLDSENLVTEVLVVANDDILVDEIESEEAGIQFLTSLTNYSNWKQTSYNNNIRGIYAGIGYSYDSEKDLFISPKPYPSWVYTEATHNWMPPIPYPYDEKQYYWDEDIVNWVVVEQ